MGQSLNRNPLDNVTRDAPPASDRRLQRLCVFRADWHEAPGPEPQRPDDDFDDDEENHEG